MNGTSILSHFYFFGIFQSILIQFAQRIFSRNNILFILKPFQP